MGMDKCQKILIGLVMDSHSSELSLQVNAFFKNREEKSDNNTRSAEVESSS